MSLSLTDALRDGGRRLVAPNGVTMLGALFLVQLLSAAAFSSIRAEMTGMLGFLRVTPASSSVSLPIAAGGALAVVAVGAMVAVSVVALRVFAMEETAELNREVYSNLLWPAFRLVLAGLVFGVMVVVGSALLVLPGLYVVGAFSLYGLIIANEDIGIVEALERSYEMTDGSKIRIVILMTVLTAFNVVLQAVGAWFRLSILAAFLSALGSALGFAVLGTVYMQLRGDADGD